MAVGATTEALANLVTPVISSVVLEAEKTYTFLTVSYAGHIVRGERARGDEVSYARIGRATVGDIVVSNINAVNRAIGVVPKGMDDLLVSSEFTVLRKKRGAKVDPMYLWSVLRSPAVIAEWISKSTGAGRHRVDWDRLRHQRIPMLPYPEQKRVGSLYRRALALEIKGNELEKKAGEALSCLQLETEAARARLVAAKPPK